MRLEPRAVTPFPDGIGAASDDSGGMLRRDEALPTVVNSTALIASVRRRLLALGNLHRTSLIGQALGHNGIVPKMISHIRILFIRMAEREGFEPPIRLPVCRISSAVLSTTQPPLRGRRRRKHPVGRGLCIQRETVKQERPVVRGGSSWRRSQGHGGRP